MNTDCQFRFALLAAGYGKRYAKTRKEVKEMSVIITNLRTFNRKERFFLVGTALGNPDFKLCEQFRKKVSETFRLDVPEDAFSAMDYHLDWIYASLFLFFNNNVTAIYFNADGRIKAHQQDVDFIIAYEDEEACHIILLEAKGVMGFTNQPLNSKAQRLKDIFEAFEAKDKNRKRVVPHFAIVSPKKPTKLNCMNWPNWMKPDNVIPWIKMDIPSGLKKITRCDKNGKASENGKYWQVTP